MKTPFAIAYFGGVGLPNSSPPIPFAVFKDFMCPLSDIGSIEHADLDATGKMIVSLKSKPDDFFYATPIDS